MRKAKREDILEEYLNDRSVPDDPDLASLARTADRLERSLNVETPDAYRERGLFVQGVAARKARFPWGRLLAPLVAASLVVAVVAVGRNARPGDALWGFRKTLDKVNLAEDPARTARRVLDEASAEVVEAETLLEDERYFPARRAGVSALILVREAAALLEDGSGEAREVGLERVEDLRDRANDVVVEAVEERRERIEERRERRERREEREQRREERRERRERNRGSGGGGGGND